MKKVKDLVKDSIFCAIVSTIIFLFNFLSLADYLYISLAITVFLGCYFQNKSVSRVIISASIIYAISNLIILPLYAVIFILPSVILGVIAAILLMKKVKSSTFLILLSSICFTVNMVIEVLFAKVIMNMDFLDYVLLDDTFGMQEVILQFSQVFVIVYFFLVLLISVLEVLLIYNVNKIYKKRIIPLIKEEI